MSLAKLHKPDSAFAIPQEWTFDSLTVADNFERHVREQLPWYGLATNAIAHVARHYIPQGGLIYDLGAATGNIGRALEETIDARRAELISIEASEEMAQRYTGPQRENLAIDNVAGFAYRHFDLAVAFLTIMFVPITKRPLLIEALRDKCRPGGAIIIFDKTEAIGGYAGTVLWRLALAGKLASGVSAEDIVAKELSLGGVQRPIRPELLGHNAIEFFRFGEFAGWLIEG
jgi:tRNA (cmo5U34)-methyltransferase